MSEDRFREIAESPTSPPPHEASASAPTTPPTATNLPSSSSSSSSPAARGRDEHVDWALEQVRRALAGIRFGQVVITVQDGLPIQIERTEKTRLR